MNRHAESVAMIAAPPAGVFAYLDDPVHLAAHMEKRSWSMAGGRMSLLLDEKRGREPGARMRLAGRVLGLTLSLDEEVIERVPPSHKVWQTVGSPRLLVVGPYRMGFDVKPQGSASRLRVFIDYDPPPNWLGGLLGPAYARWCTRRMANDAAAHFRSARRVDEDQSDASGA